jgi:hypothetical protein
LVLMIDLVRVLCLISFVEVATETACFRWLYTAATIGLVE